MLRMALHRWLSRNVEGPLEDMAGGRVRLHIIIMLACILALDAADKATLGAVAAQLKPALHIDNLEVGLLVTVTVASSALLTLPFGILVDRFNRRNLLVVGIALWSLAMIWCGVATSYDTMFAARLALGIVMAIGSPAMASLVGDSFSAAERSRIYGYVLSGELVGVAIGFLISGNVAALSWRAPFLLLAVLGMVLAYVIARRMPEPRRGGRGRLPVQDRDPSTEPEGIRHHRHPRNDDVRIKDVVREHGIEPRAPLVLREDPARMGIWQAVKYVLALPSYRMLILASALGYFYFTGLRTFVVVFTRSHFGLPQTLSSTFVVIVGLGAIAGVLVAGLLADRLVAKGHVAARMQVGAGAYFVAVVALFPGMLLPSLFTAAPFLFITAGGIGGAFPPVDAARLDVMHSRLWGRAEGVRSTIVYLAQAASPPLFGWLSGLLGGDGGAAFAVSARQSGSGNMDLAFLVLVVVLAAAGVVLLLGARSYPRDVATAVASEQATWNASQRVPPD
ncbi:MAG TPA: MFS transporter [Rhodanobacteraceae bacterium]|nr:MFS transporter [Rhodanobacteraceae bacterium]